MSRRIVSSFSLILSLCSLALATDYTALERAFKSAPSTAAKETVLQDFETKNPKLDDADGALAGSINEYLTKDKPTNQDTERLEDAISARARLEGSAAPGADVAKNARSIKASASYAGDKGVSSDSNWIGKAVEHLKNLFNFSPPAPRLGAPPALGGLGILGWGLIILLAALVIGFLIYAITRFNYQKNLARKASALLEEDEPERTADEWLELADGLTRQGRYREAVRCLYLACLLRFDEAGICRFERSHTNWEHLARFRSSTKRPAQFDFTTQTRAFDLIWYGKQVRGIEDVEQFRAWYGEALEAIRGPIAA